MLQSPPHLSFCKGRVTGKEVVRAGRRGDQEIEHGSIRRPHGPGTVHRLIKDLGLQPLESQTDEWLHVRISQLVLDKTIGAPYHEAVLGEEASVNI